MNHFKKYVVKRDVKELVEYLIHEEENNSEIFDQFCESQCKLSEQTNPKIYLRKLFKDFDVELRDALGIIYRDKQIPEKNISNAMNIFHNIIDFINSNNVNPKIKKELAKADNYIYNYLNISIDPEMNDGSVNLAYNRLKNAIEIWNNLRDKIEISLRESNMNEWWWSKKPVAQNQDVRSSMADLAKNFENELKNVFNIVVRDKKVPKMNVSKAMNIFNNITSLINSNKKIDSRAKEDLSRGSHYINSYLDMAIDVAANNGQIQLVYSRLKNVAEIWNNFKSQINRSISKV